MTEQIPSLFRGGFLPTFLRHWAAADFGPKMSGLVRRRCRSTVLSEDDSHLYLEVAMPGIRAEQIQVTYDKGLVRINAAREHKEEDRARKYYERASYQYSFCFALPSSNLDESKEPKALYEHGLLTLSFAKVRKEEPRRIAVKSS